MPRLELDRDLDGWFQIGWSADFVPGEIRTLRYFDEDLVAFRADDGRLSVLDAYCQHIGAHLGAGCITDAGVRCPFHGWVWDGDGRNVSIPYQDQPNRARRIRSWPVCERNGVVYVWSSSADETPRCDIPDVLADPTVSPLLVGRPFHDPVQKHFPGLRIHPQLVIENAVDLGHFPEVHGLPTLPEVLYHEVDEWTWHSEVGFGSGWGDRRIADRPDAASLTIHFVGIGVSYNVLLAGGVAAVVSLGTTCVDETTADLFETVWLQELPGDDESSIAKRLHFAMAPVEQDLAIWSTQRYLDPAGLATAEVRGFNELRRWTKKFYRDSVEPSPNPAPITT